MDQLWENGRMNTYMRNYSVSVINSNFDSSAVSTREFKPRAYVNPRVVKCTRRIAHADTMTVSKKIHINPNFKGSNINCFGRNCNRKIESKNDLNCVHINPNFQSYTPNGFNPKEDCAPFSRTTILKVKTYENHRKLDHDSSEKLCTNEIIEFSNKFPCDANKNGTKNDASVEETFRNVSQKPTYFWYKNNGKSCPGINRSIQKMMDGKGFQNHTKASPHKLIKNLSFPVNQLTVKKRYKLIQNTESNEISDARSGEFNYKYRLLNRYKVINIKRLKSEPTSDLKKFSFPKLQMKHADKKGNNGVCNSLSLKKVDLGKLHLPELNHTTLSVNPSFKNNNLFKSKFVYKKGACLHKRKQLKVFFDENTKYKLDKRKKCHQSAKKISNLKTFFDIRKLFPKRVSLKWVKSMTWNSPSDQWKQGYKFSNYIWRKQLTADKDVPGMSKTYPNRTLVNIGGIMYKSTINKLTRTKDRKKSFKSIKQQFIQYVKSGSTHHVVYVRGEKFLLDDNGKTLIRQPICGNNENVKSSVKRVDIGGVTYIQKSNNILMRTNTHQARHLVNHAKQKSIALLYNLHKRNNMPCMIYQRFGQCTRYSKGICLYVHDPKNVALCKKFLRGECTSLRCLLSHDVVKEKMATCHFFLKGNCNRENCPFLHVKVNKKATICKNFLQGFCKLGQNCKNRHVHQCPGFDTEGFCNKGKKCPYPHRTNTKKKNKGTKNVEDVTSKLTTAESASSEDKNNLILCEEPNKTIFPRKKVQKVKQIDYKKGLQIKPKKRKHVHQEQMKILDTSNDSTVECIPRRIKLSDLPLFIPLENDK